MSFKDALFFMTLVLAEMSTSEPFHGRHVCKQQQVVTEPVPVQQSYIRAVHRKDLQRIIYQTAYRTIFKMEIRHTNVSGCCPGWDKLSPRDTNCMKPVCEEECENGGQCTGPGFCVCSEGYTGYKCHLDIDECSGRHSCQQKCTNLPGTFECSCQDGFQLADDEYTCDLCVSCTNEFIELQAQVEKLHSENGQNVVVNDIIARVDNLTQIFLEDNSVQIIQAELANLSETTVQIDRFLDLQNEVDVLKNSIKIVDKIENLDTRVNELEESSLHTETFQKIHTQIEDLSHVKGLAETVQSLNETIQNMREDGAQTKQVEEVKKIVEELVVNRAQQDEAQAGKFQEMHREIEQIRETNGLSETVAGIKVQLVEVSARVHSLETDREEQKSEVTAHAERLQELQKELHTVNETINKPDVIQGLNKRIDDIEKANIHTDTFQKIQTQIDDLSQVKGLAETVQSLNESIQSMREDDGQAKEMEELRKLVEELVVSTTHQDEAQTDRYEEMSKQLEQLQEIDELTKTVREMKGMMEQMSARIQDLETEKATLKTNLSEAVSQYEAAVSAFQAKEVNVEHVTSDPYDEDEKPLDRLASLSAQISILEEKMADCACGQDYRG